MVHLLSTVLGLFRIAIISSRETVFIVFAKMKLLDLNLQRRPRMDGVITFISMAAIRVSFGLRMTEVQQSVFVLLHGPVALETVLVRLGL